MHNTMFIGYPEPLKKEYDLDSPAPVFRKHFTVKKEILSAKLTVCALGLGKFFINGLSLTDDLFISPYSDYNKTLWYNEFDVTDRLCAGENLISVALGNGFYNECLSTDWAFDKAPWRDNPKFLLSLEINYSGETEFVLSDNSWLCSLDDSPYRFNQFRLGEIYDYNQNINWMKSEFDDFGWRNAAIVSAPTGFMRKCPAPPIKEEKTYECKSHFKNKYGEWVFDFGQNMSGYVRIRTKQPKGTRLHIVYAEQLDEDLRRKDNILSQFFWDGETQFSELITSEKETDWKPDFSYYGFRYVIIGGFINEPKMDEVSAVFVHQDVGVNGQFLCSDEFLNTLYHLSYMSTLSNLFNMPTDCPTREKLGWCNDAQASCEQMIQNFDMTGLYQKWLQDITDAQKPDGDLPGIVPTGGWGYAWGSGPVSTGVLFEIPFRLYQYNGNKQPLCDMYPVMLRHLEFLETKRSAETGLYAHGLNDWAGPWLSQDCPTPLEFICTVLYIRFCEIALLAARELKNKNDEKMLILKREAALDAFNKAYMSEDGKCLIEEQTAISMIIVNHLYKELAPLKEQLMKTVEKSNYHFHVGMLGMQYILPALDICGLNEIGYKLLTAVGYPSYRTWIEDDATTLHEVFGKTQSCNHHMYSCVVAWFHNTILGIRHYAPERDEKVVVIKPCFLKELSYASGTYKTVYGTISVSWKRLFDDCLELSVDIPQGISAKLVLDDYYTEKNEKLKTGKNNYIIKRK